MTVDDLFNKFRDKGHELLGMFGYRYVMEVSRKTKKKPAFVKMAIDDRMAEMLLERDGKGWLGIPYLVVFPGPETRRFFEEAKLNNEKKASDYHDEINRSSKKN